MKIAIITAGSGPERKTSIASAKYFDEQITFADTQTFLYPEEYNDFLAQHKSFDVVIPIVHGDDGEDGKLQKDFEQRNITYIFSDSDTQKKCFHKESCKNLVEALGFSIPQTYSLVNSKNIDFPLIAKPQESGSSVGIYLIKNQEELNELNNPKNYLYEQYISGREFTVGVVETNQGLKVLPVMEAKKEGFIFDNKEKTTNLSMEIEVFPKDLSKNLEKQLKDLALSAHINLGIRHLSRTDVIVSPEGNIYFIEVNTIPGSAETSFIPKMIKREGLNFSDVLEFWCR